MIKQGHGAPGGGNSPMTDSETATSKERRGRKGALVAHRRGCRSRYCQQVSEAGPLQVTASLHHQNKCLTSCPAVALLHTCSTHTSIHRVLINFKVYSSSSLEQVFKSHLRSCHNYYHFNLLHNPTACSV